jgi:group I intron endonuclease
MGGIYCIFCKANNKTYIGSAKNLSTRWGEHKFLLEHQKHFNRNLQNAWNKYGSEMFEYSIKEELGEYDKKYFFAKENYWIESYRENSFQVFNIAKAEGGWGPETFLRKHEIAKKISTSLKKFNNSLSQEERNALYGKGKKGVALTEEHKQKTSRGLAGKTKSEETKRRMSAAQKKDNFARAANMSKVGQQNIGRTPINAIPIIIDGVEYKSCQHASIILGIPYKQVTKMRKAQNGN